MAVIENGTAVARELARQLGSRGLARSGGSGSEVFWTSGALPHIESLLINLWAPQARLQSLPECQADDGRGISAGRG